MVTELEFFGIAVSSMWYKCFQKKEI